MLNNYCKKLEKTKGIEKGIEQNRAEMIINLYNNNVSLDIISTSSGLSTNEVKRIINSNVNK